MYCNHCGEELTSDAQFCPSCGSSISQPNKSSQTSPNPWKNKVYRSRNNRVIAGVCAGIGYHLDIDPSIIRIIWIFVIFFGGTGVFIYIILALVLPEAPRDIEPPHIQ